MLLYAYVAPVFLAVDVKQFVIKKIIFWTLKYSLSKAIHLKKAFQHIFNVWEGVEEDA
jgi:hypothetical protein